MAKTSSFSCCNLEKQRQHHIMPKPIANVTVLKNNRSNTKAESIYMQTAANTSKNIWSHTCEQKVGACACKQQQIHQRQYMQWDHGHMYIHTLCRSEDHNFSSSCHLSSGKPSTGDLSVSSSGVALSKKSFLIWCRLFFDIFCSFSVHASLMAREVVSIWKFPYKESKQGKGMISSHMKVVGKKEKPLSKRRI